MFLSDSEPVERSAMDALGRGAIVFYDSGNGLEEFVVQQRVGGDLPLILAKKPHGSPLNPVREQDIVKRVTKKLSGLRGKWVFHRGEMREYFVREDVPPREGETLGLSNDSDSDVLFWADMKQVEERG